MNCLERQAPALAVSFVLAVGGALWVPCPMALADGDSAVRVGLTFGAALNSVRGFQESSDFNATNATLSFEGKLGRSKAALAGLRVMHDPGIGRLRLIESFAGARIALAGGRDERPIDGGTVSLTTLTDSQLALDVLLGVGRYLIKVYGEFATLEAGSEYIAPAIGLHYAKGLTRGLHFESGVHVAHAVGIGSFDYAMSSVTLSLGFSYRL